MIVLGFLFLALAFLGIYSGFTNRDPRTELASAFNGGGGSPPGAGGNGVETGNNESGGLSGKLALIPSRFCAGGVPRYIDASVIGEVEGLCSKFNVKVSSGYRAGANTTHRNGGAADFVGPTANMRALYNYSLAGGYAWVEPWHDSTTIGVHGTTGPHVHISFVLPNGVTGGS